MHSMFLPGQPLPDLDKVESGRLYHVQLKDGGIGTVQREGEVWRWRHLSGGAMQRGSLQQLNVWLNQQPQEHLNSGAGQLE